MNKPNKAENDWLRYAQSVFARFILFFLFTAFMVTCNIILFVHSMQITMDIDQQILRANAGYTLGNIVMLSLLFALVDALRQHLMVDRAVHEIMKMTGRIAAGDFTARIRPESMVGGMREFRAVSENLNKMAEELSGIESLRTDFIANVSHELKTPLAIIQNYATLLQAPDLSEERRTEYAKDITDATKRLVSLITNILKLNKLENQQIFPDVRRYDLGEQLRECALGFEDAWEKKDIELDAEQIEDIAVQADPELMTLVWNNLLSNAIKFTPRGGKITVRLWQESGSAVAQVQDTGCGIPPETGRHIFEKFYQGDISHATQGNGLGLALVKRVVDITGGEVAVESVLGQGSTFTVKLPCDTASNCDETRSDRNG